MCALFNTGKCLYTVPNVVSLAVVTLQVVRGLVAEGAVVPLLPVHLVRQPHVLVQVCHLLVTDVAAKLFAQMDTTDVHRTVGLFVGRIRAVITFIPNKKGKSNIIKSKIRATIPVPVVKKTANRNGAHFITDYKKGMEPLS
jgi:hypothetical protein